MSLGIIYQNLNLINKYLIRLLFYHRRINYFKYFIFVSIYYFNNFEKAMIRIFSSYDTFIILANFQYIYKHLKLLINEFII